ncbi:MAG: MFS transporter [Chloroflexi bacterium]|nr:MFS transporter [Chloroflexota bacterium]
MSRYLVFAVASSALFLSALSGTAVSVAFPVITESFDTNLVVAGWILSIHQLVATTSMPLGGKFADTYGKKFTFQLCLLLFAVGSALAAVAPNVPTLIGGRFLQGVAFGGFMPCASGIVADEFPQSRMRAIGFIGGIMPIGQIIGPNLGGWLVEAFGWRSIFWFNIPLALIAFVGAGLLLRSGEKQAEEIDLVGAGYLGGSLSALMVGLSMTGKREQFASGGWLLVPFLIAAGIMLMIFFLRREVKVQHPIIDLGILRKRPFAAANVYSFFFGAGVMSVFAFMPLYTVSVYHLSILESGFILTPRSVGMIMGTLVSSFFLPRWGYRTPMIVGTLIVVASLLLLSTERAGADVLGMKIGSTVWLLMLMMLSGLGIGVTGPAANNASLELMPDRIPTIIGIRGMFSQTGGLLGITTSTLVLHNVGDMSRGFFIVFLGLSTIMLMVIPLVFLMPSGRGVR